MPSPFPGMDPWLESPDIWPGFHDILVIETVRVLQPQLRARRYYANPGERVWLIEPHRPTYPEVAIIRQTPPREKRSAVAVLEPDEPVRVQHAEIEVREPFVEIFDAVGNRLITGIEFIGPTNKSDRQGREMYERKQLELRDTGVHLVEIDLIRRGPHILDVPEDVVQELRPWEYLVNLVRRGATEYEIYRIHLRDRLPRVRIPLKAGDDDAVLDLQQVFEQSYNIGPYPERLAYGQSPSLALSAEDNAWADQILKSNGLRG